MKDYIDQFYNEGLATTFYLRPVKWVSKRIKNEKILKFITLVIKILYTVFVLILAWFMFWDRYPL